MTPDSDYNPSRLLGHFEGKTRARTARPEFLNYQHN